jgi:hypothetical protein
MPYVDDAVGYGGFGHDFSSYDEGLKTEDVENGGGCESFPCRALIGDAVRVQSFCFAFIFGQLLYCVSKPPPSSFRPALGAAP